MKKWIKEELVFKLDFVNGEFEIGWIWITFLLLGEKICLSLF